MTDPATYAGVAALLAVVALAATHHPGDQGDSRRSDRGAALRVTRGFSPDGRVSLPSSVAPASARSCSKGSTAPTRPADSPAPPSPCRAPAGACQGATACAAARERFEPASARAGTAGHAFQKSGCRYGSSRLKPGDRLDVHRHVRAELAEAGEERALIDCALAHRGPRDACAVLGHPHGRVAEARGERVGLGQRLEARDRVLERPQRVAGIEVRRRRSRCPPSSTSRASSVECMSPAWFSTAIFTPASAACDAARPADLHHLLDVPVDAAVASAGLPTCRAPREAPANPTARATRIPSARCSSAVPQFGLNAFEVGQMLQVPTCSCTRRAAGVLAQRLQRRLARAIRRRRGR